MPETLNCTQNGERATRYFMSIHISWVVNISRLSPVPRRLPHSTSFMTALAFWLLHVQLTRGKKWARARWMLTTHQNSRIVFQVVDRHRRRQLDFTWHDDDAKVIRNDASFTIICVPCVFVFLFTATVIWFVFCSFHLTDFPSSLIFDVVSLSFDVLKVFVCVCIS